MFRVVLGPFADGTSMDISLHLILVVVLATIVGYFVGRITGFLRDDQWFD